MLDLEIAEITENRGRICSDLLRSLPLWFGIESAILQYVSDVESMPTFVANIKGESVGFISLHLRNEWTSSPDATHPGCMDRLRLVMTFVCEIYGTQRLIRKTRADRTSR